MLGQIEPAGQCTNGFYCTLNSTEQAPTSQAYGDQCPRGFYCPDGKPFTHFSAISSLYIHSHWENYQINAICKYLLN